jgi:iron complex outermembrane receptor protein
MHEDAFETAAGASAQDGWQMLDGSVRLDWTPTPGDQLTLLAGASTGSIDAPAGSQESIATRNLTLRWTRQTGNGGELQAQAYYDRIERDERPTGGGAFHVDTYDAEIQHSWVLGPHHVVAGAGVRDASYVITGTSSLFFVPPGDDLLIANVFAQDSIALTTDLTATVGLKAERLPYAGTSVLPEARLAWKVTPSTLLWASVERAVRSPTPFDETVQERAGPITLSGNPQFRTEKLTAAEIGVRAQPSPALSFSVTGFYHWYDDLRTVELLPLPGFSLAWANNLEGHTYGIEAWAEWRVTPWWKLSAGGTWLEEAFKFKPGASGILGPSQLGSDPPYVAKVVSSMNLAHGLTADFQLRTYAKLPDPVVPAYAEINGRLAWQVRHNLTLSVTGTNLLHDRHQEYPTGDFIPRRIMGGLEVTL